MIGYLDHYLNIDLADATLSGVTEIRERNRLHRLIVPLVFHGVQLDIEDAPAEAAQAAFIYELPDGTKYSYACAIENGSVVVPLHLSVVETPGGVDAQVEVYGTVDGTPGKLFSTAHIRLVIGRDLYDAETMAEIVSDPTVYEEIVASEAARVAAEAARVTAEAARAAAETARAAAETERISAEAARVTAETARAAAEAEREAYITELQEAVERGDFDGETGPVGPEGQKGDKGDTWYPPTVEVTSGAAIANTTKQTLDGSSWKLNGVSAQEGRALYELGVAFPRGLCALVIHAADKSISFRPHHMEDTGSVQYNDENLYLYAVDQGTLYWVIIHRDDEYDIYEFHSISSKQYADKQYVDQSIPTKVSDLTNDAGYITSSDLPTVPTISTDISADATSDTKTASPKAVKDYVDAHGGGGGLQPGDDVSELVNDAGYITSADLPTKVSDLTNDAGFITAAELPTVPTKVSDLTNDAGYAVAANLASVATSGSYNDLSNKPTIPTVPTISTDISADATSDTKTSSPKAVKDYVDAHGGGLQPGDDISELVNDAGYITESDLDTTPTASSSHGVTSGGVKTYVDNNVAKYYTGILNQEGNAVTGLSAGTTFTEAMDYVKANRAVYLKVRSYSSTTKYTILRPVEYSDSSTLKTITFRGKVIKTIDGVSRVVLCTATWAGTVFPYSETVLAKSEDIPTVPTKVSDLTNDEGFITSADLPTKVSDLTNDAGYVNATQVGTTIGNWIENNGIDYDSVYDKPVISTNIAADATSNTKVASPKAVKDYVDAHGGGGGGGLQPGDNVSELVNDAGYVAAEANTVSYHIGQMQDLGNGVYLYGTTYGQDEADFFAELESAYPHEGIYYDGMLMTKGEINGNTFYGYNADPVTLSPIDPNEPVLAVATDYETNFAIFSSEEYDDEDLCIDLIYEPASEGFVENRLHDELADRLGGLKLKKAYEGAPASPQEGDIAHDSGTDTWGIYSGGSWSQYTPDPNTLYFLVEP